MEITTNELDEEMSLWDCYVSYLCWKIHDPIHLSKPMEWYTIHNKFNCMKIYKMLTKFEEDGS